MKTIPKVLLIGCAAGLGLGVGFAVRKKTSADAANISAATAATETKSSKPSPRTTQSRAAIPAPDDSRLATQLARDLSMSRGVTRWLYWLEAIEKAAPADFPRLARLAEGNPNALRLVAERWVELNPRHLFDTLVAESKTASGLPLNELSNTLFNEWCKRDPQAVVDALSSVENFGLRTQWRRNVATTIVEKEVELGLRLMSEWHIDNHGPRMTGVAKWATADPRHAAEFALANPAGYASQLTMETIGNEWAKKDPSRALEFAAGQPGDLGDRLGAAALKAWAGSNLNEASAWLTGTDERTRNRLSPAFVEAWAKQDSAAALAWCDANLSGSSLAQSVGGAMRGIAEKDVAAAAQLVAKLNPSEARNEAATVVAKKWFPEFSSDQVAKPEAIAWLAGLDSDSIRRAVGEIEWQWASADPKSMATFLSAASPDQVSAQAYNILARELSRKNPVGALEWANQLPADRALSAGGDAFAEWRTSQPDAAMKWLNDLAPTDARREPFFQSAIRSMAYDSQAAERLAALPAQERPAARSVIEGMHLADAQRSRLLEALSVK